MQLAAFFTHSQKKSLVTVSRLLVVKNNDEITLAVKLLRLPADLTMSKRPGTSYRIEIHFTVFNRLYL